MRLFTLVLSMGLFASCQSNQENSETEEVVNQEASSESVQTPTQREVTLKNVLWETVSISGFEGEIPSDNNPSIAIVEERVSGTTACNKYSGSFTLNNDELSFSTLAVTKMACMGDLGTIEQHFLRAMESVATYEIAEKTLILSNSEGEKLLTLEFMQFIEL